MAGFGREGVQPISVNAPPLVAPAAPVATGDAVQQLVNAFRNGEVNANDVIHSLTVAPTQNKADLAALNASIPQSNLAGAQAQAALPLVQPQAALAQQTLARQTADQKYGGGVAAYQQYAPLFGKPAIIQDAQGNPDYDAMGQAGNGYMATMAQQNYARMILDTDAARTETGIDTATRAPYRRTYSKLGPENTPGSPLYNQAVKIFQSTNEAMFGGQPGKAIGGTPAPQAATPGPSYAGTSTSIPDSELKAKLGELGMPLSEAAKTPPDQARQIIDSFNAKQQQPAAPAPVIQPSQPQTGQYIPGVGVITGPSANLMAAPQIAEDLRKQPEYSQWSTMMSQGGDRFLNTAARIERIPVAEQRSGKKAMNTLDMDLAENIIKMEDPGNAIREFKWDKLVEGAPLFERLKNFKSEALKTGALTPESRARLIDLGREVLAAKERSVLPQLQLAKSRADASGAPLDQILTARDQQILNGGTLVPARSAAESPQGKLVVIPGRGRGYLDPKGMFTPAP